MTHNFKGDFFLSKRPEVLSLKNHPGKNDESSKVIKIGIIFGFSVNLEVKQHK